MPKALSKMRVAVRVCLIIGSAAVRAYAQPGFYSIDSFLVPKMVRLAVGNNSVFRIFFIDRGRTLTVLPSAAPQGFVDAFSSQSEKAVVVRRLRECQQGGLSQCPIYGYSGGTAFLGEDKRTLWTALRVAHPDFFKTSTPAAPGRALVAERVAILLFDEYNRVVFDSDRGGESATLFYKALAEMPKPNFVAAQDYAVVKLSHDIFGSTLDFVSERQGVEESVFGVGFADRTENRWRDYGVPDSTGDGLVVTTGMLLSKEQFLARYNLRLSAAQGREAFEGRQEYCVLSNADSTSGLSGGPVLNEDGNVVGLLAHTDEPDGGAPILCAVNVRQLNSLAALLERPSVDKATAPEVVVSPKPAPAHSDKRVLSDMASFLGTVK